MGAMVASPELSASEPQEGPPEGPANQASPQGEAWRYERGDRARRNGPLRRRFRDLRRRLTAPLVPALVPPLLRLIARTWRVTTTHGERRAEVLESPDGCVAVLWHGRMAAAAPVFRGVDAAILVSASGDGELARAFLERLGYETLRGSTGKVDTRALAHLRDTLRSGRAIAITPDGPRGPRHHVNRGAAFLARATRTPVLPIGFAASRALRLKSWDRFTIPAPFARVHVAFAEPVEVRGKGTASLAAAGETIRTRLMDAEAAAHAALDVEVDW